MVTTVMSIDAAWQNVLKIAEAQGAKAMQDLGVQEALAFIKQETVTTKRKAPIAEIKSGTSGSRSIIGKFYTVNNFRRIVRAYLDIALSTAPLLTYNGQKMSYAQYCYGPQGTVAMVQQQGVPLFGDTRFMNEEFKRVTAIECLRAGMKVFYVRDDEFLAIPTPVGSLWLKENSFGFSFNHTPSHNKADNDGIKFNPYDGGPAGDFIVDPVNARIAEYLEDDSFENDEFALGCQTGGVQYIYEVFTKETTAARAKERFVEVEPNTILSWYALRLRQKVDLQKVVEKVRAGELAIVHTPFYGSGNGYVREVFKTTPDILDNGVWVQNEARNVLFDGKAPRPNPANLQAVAEQLKASGRKLTLGYLTDPDADRVMFVTLTDGQTRVVPMNEFLVAEAFYLYYIAGYRGRNTQAKTIFAKTLATSDKLLAVAKLINKLTKEKRVPEFIKPFIPAQDLQRICLGQALENDYIDLSADNSDFCVGFKYFHDVLANGQAIVAGEESDGQSAQDWTLDKDGLYGGFLAQQMTAVLEMDLGTFLNKIDAVLQAEALPYRFIKGGLEIRLGSNGERDEKMALYQERLEYVFNRPDKNISVATNVPAFGTLTVQEVLTKDGVKVKFTDLTNGLLRKSGTEPLIKGPTEADSKEKADILFRILTAVASHETITKLTGTLELQDKDLKITISYT